MAVRCMGIHSGLQMESSVLHRRSIRTMSLIQFGQIPILRVLTKYSQDPDRKMRPTSFRASELGKTRLGIIP